MERPSTFLFARLILVGRYNATVDEKEGLIGEALTAGSITESHGFLWRFLEVSQFRDKDRGRFFVGYLVKYRPEDVETVKENRLALEPIDDKISAKSRFVLHVGSGLIAYHPVPQKISLRSFERQFAALFKLGLANMFIDVEIARLIDETSIWQALDRFTRIDRFDVTLRPTNPDYREEYRDIDDQLKELRAAKLRQTIVARNAVGAGDPGLDLKADPDSRAKITMASDGYGEASIRGIMDDGRRKTVSTKQTPISVEAPSEHAPAGELLDAVSPTVARLEKHEK